MGWINIAHLHLLLNHVPTVATIVGLGLLLLAFVRRDSHLTWASFELFFIIALATLPVYLSGAAAEGQIQGVAGVSGPAIELHGDSALLAFLSMEITGLAAWLGLWQFRRASRPSRPTLGAVLLLSIVTIVLMTQAATLGGEIRHPEIRAEQEVADESADVVRGPLSAASVASFVNDRQWVWPAAETLHFVGLCLVFGVLLALNLRILGAMKALPFSALHGLLPWAMAGFGLNLVTGMLFFVSAADQYTQNGAFYWKVAFIGLAGAHFLYLTVFGRTWRLQPGDEAPPIDKLVAVCGIGMWVGVIYAGRMLPFLGNAF